MNTHTNIPGRPEEEMPTLIVARAIVTEKEVNSEGADYSVRLQAPFHYQHQPGFIIDSAHLHVREGEEVEVIFAGLCKQRMPGEVLSHTNYGLDGIVIEEGQGILGVRRIIMPPPESRYSDRVVYNAGTGIMNMLFGRELAEKANHLIQHGVVSQFPQEVYQR